MAAAGQVTNEFFKSVMVCSDLFWNHHLVLLGEDSRNTHLALYLSQEINEMRSISWGWQMESLN